MSLISVIVTTYNRPDALRACLDSLIAQTDRNFEILIADDGSGESTREALRPYVSQELTAIPVIHVYQEDRGFRAGTIRNKAVAESRGEYIIFTDGDCIAFPDFVALHRRLAEPGYFVPGNRILLSEEYTQKVLSDGISLYRKAFFFFLGLFLTGKINHCLSLLRLPLGYLRLFGKTQWKKAKTCNLALWRKDFMAVNGFDEAFEGWGQEDSDLVIRMIHSGIFRKTGRYAIPILHLWHPENDRGRQESNLRRFRDRLRDKAMVSAEQGIRQHLAEKTSRMPQNARSSFDAN
jgi:glycosyltransferase involved in cell wall biosynthesis